MSAIELAQRRVIEAAVAYAMGTYPDDHPLDVELRAAVRELARTLEEEA